MEDSKRRSNKGCDCKLRCVNCGAINYAYENEMPDRCMKCDGESFIEI